MFMDLTRREQIVSSLADKTYRDAFVADQIRIGVPLQIKQMRDERGITQEQLGQQIQPPMAQESVWRLENPNKANLTIGTLLRVASALDVGLVVRFVPFSEVVDTTPWISGSNRSIPSFAKDQALRNPMVASLSTTSVVFGTATMIATSNAGWSPMGTSLDMSKSAVCFAPTSAPPQPRPSARGTVKQIETQLSNAA